MRVYVATGLLTPSPTATIITHSEVMMASSAPFDGEAQLMDFINRRWPGTTFSTRPRGGFIFQREDDARECFEYFRNPCHAPVRLWFRRGGEAARA